MSFSRGPRWFRAWPSILLVILLWAASPISWAGALAIDETAHWPLRLSDHVQQLRDPLRQHAIDPRADVPADMLAGFQPLSDVSATFRHDAPTWLLLDLESSRQGPVSLVFVPGSNNAGRIDYYVRQQGRWRHHATGDAVAMSRPDGHDRVHGLVLELAPGEQARLLVRVETTRPLQLKPRLHTEASFQAAQGRAAVWDGILFGGLLLLGWGAFLIAVLAPNRYFGVMSVLCVVIALYEATVRGYTKVYLWPGSVLWAERSPSTLGFASMMLFLVFIVGITHRERLYLPCRGLLTGLAAAFATLVVMAVAGLQPLVATLGFPLVIVYFLTVLFCAVMVLKSGAPGGRLILLTGLFILGHSALRLMTWSGLLPDLLTNLGVDDPTTHPLLAVLGLGLNVGVLTAWIIEIGRQRREAREALVWLKQEEGERLKRQVDQQTEALNRSLQYAHAETRRKSEMLSYIGHDLRAPLATIIGHVRRLAEHSSAKGQAHVHAIERSAGYQLSLIDEILDYAKYELKPLEIQPAPARLSELLEDVIGHARSLSHAQGNQFAIEALSPLPVLVRVDAKRLQQILLNLISNAAKFTRAGRIRLTVSADVSEGDAVLTFSVHDSGSGIAPAEQARLFNAFEQGEPRQGSVGLGLHIARRNLSNMGGELTLSSRPGLGSEFCFTVSVEPLSQETFRQYESMRPDDEREKPPRRPAGEMAADDVPPVELRVDLAKFARDGQLTDIEEWLKEQARRHPEYAHYFQQVEAALQELDFERIEAVALDGARCA